MSLQYQHWIERGVSQDAIEEFIEHRRLKKSPLTQLGLDRNLKQACDMAEFGHSPDEAIHETIDAGWQGIKVDWLLGRLKPRKVATRDRALRDDLTDRSWASNVHQLERKS